MRGAMLLADMQQQRLRFAAAPSIPEDYKAGIGPFLSIARGMGSCGTAPFLRKPVYTQDTETDTLWKGCREVAVRNGLRAIWSTPILSDDNAVLGTFAMWEPRLPSSEHIQRFPGSHVHRPLFHDPRKILWMNLTALKINLDILQTGLASHGSNEVRARVGDSAAFLESTMDAIENVMSELPSNSPNAGSLSGNI